MQELILFSTIIIILCNARGEYSRGWSSNLIAIIFTSSAILILLLLLFYKRFWFRPSHPLRVTHTLTHWHTY